MAGPAVSLLEFVQERRFSWRNKRHRRKLLEDDSLIEFVANHEAPPLWVSLADLQLRYRHDYGLMDRSYPSGAARSFESCLRRLDDEGVPLEPGLVVL